MEEFAAALNGSTEFRLFLSAWESGRDAELSPAPGASPGFIVARAAARSPRPFLMVASGEREAERLSRELEGYGAVTPLLFPASGGGTAPQVAAERRSILARLAAGEEGIPPLVTFPAALAADLPAVELFRSSLLRLASGGFQDPGKLAEKLVGMGYEFQNPVMERGSFARRGGIVDLYPGERDCPIRIEFDGETIASLRQFDPQTQRSTGAIEAAEIHPLSGEGTASLFDYLPPGCRIVFAGDFDPDLESGWGRGRFPRLFFFSDRFETPRQDGSSAVRFSLRTLDRFKYRNDSAPYPLLAAVGELLQDGYRVLLHAHNPGEADRLREILDEKGFCLHPGLRVAIGETGEGFIWEEPRLAVIGDSEIFSRYRLPRPRQKYIGTVQPLPRSDFHPGDWVVHLDHGIGRFLGVREIDSGGEKREMLVIRYAENARLFCALTQAHLVSRYLGSGQARPHLDRLGGGRWPRARTAAKRAVRDLAAELLEVQARRAAVRGRQFSPDTHWQREFEAAFIYPETADQSKAIREIKQDLESPRPMDRLLCGDVGYGKTEVAIRAAFKTAMEGAQAAILVPTTVLAQQHTRTFRERMSNYPIRVEMLSRLVSPREQKTILADLAAGKVDIVIGTHRLLQRDVAFRDLGLVIIDEEQRFGVRHKERLKKMRELVDILTLTATPIPRTLYLSLTGARDLSAINTPPQDRLAVETRVVHYDPRVIKNAVRREADRGGQVFYLHNRVRDIEQVKVKLEAWFPDLRVATGHGQMDERELASVMDRFAGGEIDLLVCTTIIESGLDIPNANTIIVENAHRFGLADLYQLRGRVGRFKHLAYAYFFYPPAASLETAARRRLQAIEEFSRLGAGYGLALRDLEIRGAGNILGREQHGHIAAVGFELYCRLLEESVSRLKGEEKPPPPKTAIEFELPMALPLDYVGTETQRIDLYRRWAALGGAKEIEDWLEELRDRFGPPPEEADLLARTALLKLTAAAKGITAIRRVEDKYVLLQEDKIRKAWPAPPPDTPAHLARFLSEATRSIHKLPRD